ncbi:MAG TPA: hypothetical protein VLT32_16185 [Candidatus Sulfomarinibacteraceae bacterium]|nr:hypothetical protein [Candidatus Sulfomarinibacteraceae bacterium]
MSSHRTWHRPTPEFVKSPYLAPSDARIHHWRIAFASAKEVDAHLTLLARAGAVDEKRAAEVLDLFDQVRAMTWRLLHPKR